MLLNVFYHPENDLVLPDYGITIPVAPDRALKAFQEVQKIQPSLTYSDLKTLSLFTPEDLLRVHHKAYVEKLFGSEEELTREIMTCFELVKADGTYHRYFPDQAKKRLTEAFKVILRRASTTYHSSLKALDAGFSYHLGGGSHHAMSFGGRGFGLINDIVITLRKLQSEKKIKTAWVVDVDAHKGDGTSELTKDDLSIITLSIHMEKGWPLDEGDPLIDPWFIPSNVDIPVGEHQSRDYLMLLEQGLETLEKKYPRPDLVLIVNGADPYEHDELQSSALLKLTKEEMLKRDLMLYHFFNDLKIPQSYVMSGGYGQRTWEIYAQFLNSLALT